MTSIFVIVLGDDFLKIDGNVGVWGTRAEAEKVLQMVSGQFESLQRPPPWRTTMIAERPRIVEYRAMT